MSARERGVGLHYEQGRLSTGPRRPLGTALRANSGAWEHCGHRLPLGWFTVSRGTQPDHAAGAALSRRILESLKCLTQFSLPVRSAPR